MVELKFDLCEVVKDLDPESQRQLAHTLALQPHVITFVVQQILDGCTDFGLCSDRDLSATSDPTGLDWAMRKIAEHADEIAAGEIQHLNESLRHWEQRAIAHKSKRCRQFMFLLTYMGESRIVRATSESQARSIVIRQLNWSNDVECRYLVTEGPPGILIEKESLNVRISDD